MGNDRIRQLYEAILALKSGKISAMPPLSGGDEVALLGSALNEVLDSSARALDTLRDEQSKFISTAAHDLRNPVSALKGFIGVLLESHSAQSPEERQLLIQTEHAADALVALLHDMEDISALNHSKFSLSPYPTPVSAFVYDCVQYFLEEATEKNIRLETIRPESKIIAVFDAQYMRHAIGHLVRNAIAFSSSGTFVTVAAARRDSMLFFSVTDQGQGIPASEIPSLFKDFARISVRPTGGEHTTRLGLGIVRRIVEAHGGTTHVQSVPQQGSTFTIQLPWKEHVTEQ